jgi:exodeoxyribonuclease VII large subunit
MQLFTVTEIAQYLKQSLGRDSQLQDLWVSGEVSNLVRSAAGHAYFTLKDASAQIRCALFRGGRGAELLTDGGAVNAHGRVSFYENRGQLQLYVDMVQPSGLGALALELERLKTQLDEEGLFDHSRKRPLPLFPKRIGVVTSEQGAVLHDIRNVVERRYPLAELVVCASAVQGDQAVSEVIDALRTLNAEGDIDVIIVARGGGSLEELSAFNSEHVARAIHASHAPVVSAVGHETDVTIADLVADVRAPTPSAAAELATLDTALLAAEVYALVERARSTISYDISERWQSVESLSQRMQGRLPDIGGWRQRVDDLLGQGSRALITLVRSSVQETNALRAQLQALNPSAVLGRGYAVVAHRTSGAIVTSAGQVKPGDVVEATVQDGRFDAMVSKDTKSG